MNFKGGEAQSKRAVDPHAGDKKKGRPREATLSTGAVLFWRDSEALAPPHTNDKRLYFGERKDERDFYH